MEDGVADCKQCDGHELAILPGAHDDSRNCVARILTHDYAPQPFDIAFARTQFSSETFYRLQRSKMAAWQDVAANGYPESAVHRTVRECRIQQRSLKGHIQRCIPEGTLSPGNNPPCFELSFAVTKGLSGAPVFVHRGDHDQLIGVAVGSTTSQVVAYEHSEYVDEGKQLSERTLRVEEYGIAHDMGPLLDWQPSCADGKSLIELSEEYWTQREDGRER
jgi:hypothetical protein